MSESFRSVLNEIPRHFSKIIFGTSGIKKPQKVYASFQIPSNETIVAYIKSAVPFAGPLIVITDCCLYSFLHAPIPFTEICRFIVTQKDEKASVVMSDASGGEDILGSTLIAKNILNRFRYVCDHTDFISIAILYYAGDVFFSLYFRLDHIIT